MRDAEMHIIPITVVDNLLKSRAYVAMATIFLRYLI